MSRLSELQSINLNELLVLDALLDEGNVTRAARRVGLSQSAMSHALGRLRRSFDDQLLVRSGNRLVLTPRAEQLKGKLRAGLEQLARAVRGEVAFDPATSQRRFTIATTDIVAIRVLPPFLERMRLSMAEDQQGLYLHASPAQRRLVLQIPQTRDFTALELSLAGLADAGGGLRCEVILGSQTGFLFQSALSLFVRDRLGRRSHVFDEPHVHSCPPGGTVRIDRMFLAPALDRCDAPKLSIILPRQAHDFRLSCHDLVVSRT